MSPTFEPGHHVLVDTQAYATSMPSRGDFVIVRGQGGDGKRYLKRVVALPGEEVRTLDSMLLVDGAYLDEPYLRGLPSTLGLDDTAWTQGSDEYFVLGDNRPRSTDSRDFGPVSSTLIVGKVWFRYWPLRLWGGVE